MARHACAAASDGTLTSVMPRVVQLLMLVLLLGQLAGAAGLAGEDRCGQGCEDEAEGKACPPLCTTCTCAPHAGLTTLTGQPGLALPLPSLEKVGFADGQRTPSSPEPHEILHVPRSLAS